VCHRDDFFAEPRPHGDRRRAIRRDASRCRRSRRARKRTALHRCCFRLAGDRDPRLLVELASERREPAADALSMLRG
jgi:hypothetical protein